MSSAFSKISFLTAPHTPNSRVSKTPDWLAAIAVHGPCLVALASRDRHGGHDMEDASFGMADTVTRRGWGQPMGHQWPLRHAFLGGIDDGRNSWRRQHFIARHAIAGFTVSQDS